MEINTHGLKCSIEITPPDNEDWMVTHIDIQVPSFAGAFTCTIQSEEYKNFINVLKQLSESNDTPISKTWGNMEDNIELSFNINHLGGLTGTYKFSSNNFSLGPTLKGDFEADQTYIKLWLKQAIQDLTTIS